MSNKEAADSFKHDFRKMLVVKKLARAQIFNMDENGLQFKKTPTKLDTFAPKDVSQVSRPKNQLEK